MRGTTGWAIAALVAAAGCGKTGGQGTSKAAGDAHAGPDQVCGTCSVEGSGEVVVDGHTLAFAFGPTAVTFFEPPGTAGGLYLAGYVTVTRCTRESGVLRAELTVNPLGLEPLTAVVTDGGAKDHDTVSVTPPAVVVPVHDTRFTIPTLEISSGDIRIAGLDRCEAPCGEGQCLCPDDHLTCEPCAPPVVATPPDPPPPPPPMPQ